MVDCKWNPQKMVEKLKDCVIGQDRYLEDLCTSVWLHMLRKELYDSTGKFYLRPKLNMLVLGKSGTGKTSAIQQLAQMLDLCVVIEDSSLFTGAGWKGREVSSIVKDVVTSAESKIHADYAIVVLDEIDKMVTNQSPHSSFSAVNSLLKMMEGAEIVHEEGNKTWRMDTSNLLFICLGAFDGLENIILNRLNKGKKLGFRTEDERFIPDNIFSLAERQDLLHYGMNTQFLGRIAMITATNELGESELEKILMSSNLSVVIQFDSLLYAALGIKVSITENAAKEIAKRADQSGTGARALLYELADELKTALYRVDLKKTCQIKLDYRSDEKKMILKYQENERKCQPLSWEKRIPVKQVKEELLAIPLEIEQYNLPSVVQYAEMIAEQFYIENSQVSVTYTYQEIKAATYLLAAVILLLIFSEKDMNLFHVQLILQNISCSAYENEEDWESVFTGVSMPLYQKAMMFDKNIDHGFRLAGQIFGKYCERMLDKEKDCAEDE